MFFAQRFASKKNTKLCFFKQNKRAYISFLCLTFLFVLSLFAEILANDKPLFLKYEGDFYFPIFKEYTDATFGGDFPTPADYKDPIIVKNIQEKGWMIMPLIPFSYNTVDYDIEGSTPSKPSASHWLGTDEEGRDILVRCLYGFRLSLIFAVLLTFFSSVIGIIAGALQGYFGGKIDLFFQRFMEIWETLPQLFIIIIIASIFTPSFFNLLIILILFSWVSLTGMVRAEFLRSRNMEYVKAAKVMGAGHARIIFKHILPNAIVATITFVPFLLADGIVALTSLDFLGLGLPPEYPSLGDLVRQGKDNLQAPWIGITIFCVLSVLLSLLIFIGEGVRDAFDTRKNN